MSSAESSTFNRHGFGRPFASGAARQSHEMVHVPGYSLAERVRSKIADNRSYDKRYETNYNKKGSESYSIGSFIRKSFMPGLVERTAYPKLDKLKTRFNSGQCWTGNQSDNIRQQMNNAKQWLDSTSSDAHAYEIKSFQTKLELACSDIDAKQRTIQSLRDQLDKSDADLIQSQTKERQLEDLLENAKRDLKKARNESNQDRDLADHEREQRLRMEQEFEGLLNSQKQHIYNLHEELEQERSAAKIKESDKDIILDLERNIKRFQTELGIERRLKDEAKQDHAEIQVELDELLNENEGLRNKLRQSKQDNERLQDQHQDLIEEYKGIMEINLGEEIETRILEGEAIARKKFDQERAELVQQIEQYRKCGEQLEEENNEFKVRMQRKVEELKAVRSQLSNCESYRQKDIDRLLQEKELLKTELKKKKKNLTSLEGAYQELLETISQMEREMKRLQRRRSNTEESFVVKNDRFEMEKKLESKELEISNLDAKIKDLQASLRCQNGSEEDISVSNLKLEADLHKMEAKLSEKKAQIASLKKLNSDLTHKLQMQESNYSDKMHDLENELSQKILRLQEISEGERKEFAEKIDELEGQKVALQDSCKSFEDIASQTEGAALDHQVCQAKIKQLENENIELVAKLQELTEQFDKIKGQNAALKDSCKHLEVEVQNKEEAALENQACEARNKELQDENAELAATLQELTAHVYEIKEQNAALKDSCKDYEEAALEHQSCEPKIKQFENENTKLAAKLRELTEQFDKINKENAALQDSSSRSDSLAAQNEEAAAAIQASEAKVIELQEKNAELQAQLLKNNDAMEELKESRSNVEVLKRQASELEADLQAKDSAIAEIQGQEYTSTELKEENETLQKEIIDLKASLEEAESKVAENDDAQLQDLKDLLDRTSAQEKELAAANTGLKKEIKELKYSLKETESYLETKQDNFEKEVQELEQKIVFMKAEENQLRRCVAELESKLNEERKKANDIPKQDLENEGKQLATLEAKIKDLESDKQELENIISSSKKQLQDQNETFEATRNSLKAKIKDLESDKRESENMICSSKKQLQEQKELFVTTRNALIKKIEDTEKISQQIVTEQIALEAKLDEKEAALKDNATKIAEIEQLLAKSEEERLQLQYEKDLEISQTVPADDSEQLKEEIQVLRDSLKNMQERGSKIQDNNHEMKKKVDAADKLQKELEHQIKGLNNELSKVKQDLEDAEIEIKALQDERDVSETQEDDWEEIAEQRKSEVKAKDELINEIDEENRKYRADNRKFEFKIRELEDTIEGLESEKEECQELKEFYKEQFEKRKDSSELLERIEDELKRAYEDMNALSKEKNELAMKCQMMEHETTKSGCEKQKDKSAEEKQMDAQNGGYGSDFEEDDEKSASEHVDKEYLSDNISLASYVSEGDYVDNNNEVDDNNSNKVDNSNCNSNNKNNNASTDNNQNHIESSNEHDDDEDGSVNFSDDSGDHILKIIPSDTSPPSASTQEQGSAQNSKSIPNKTGDKKSSSMQEAKGDMTLNNDEQVQHPSKDNSFDESSDNDDFSNGGYVPSFAGTSTGPQLDNAKKEDVLEEITVDEFEEDDTNATSMANQRPTPSGKSNHDTFEEDDMLSSFITTQKKKKKDPIQVSKQRKMEIELGLADNIDDLIDEIIESEGSEDEAAAAKAAKKKGTAKGSLDKAAKTDAMSKAKNGIAENNNRNGIQIAQDSGKKRGRDMNEKSEENITEDITVEEINLNEADYFEHVEPLPLDTGNEAEAVATSTSAASAEPSPSNAAERANDDPSTTGIERRSSDLLMSPSFQLPQRGLPPLAGRAGALPPLTGQAKMPSLGAQVGVLRPRRKKNKSKKL